MNSEILLGVNIDHVATIRQARGTRYPEPLQAALIAEEAGADGITLHLREDRRHIQDRDVEILSGMLQTRMNLEMAITEEMLSIASRIKPNDCCLVPERREELTTEGGLDVAGQADKMMTPVRVWPMPECVSPCLSMPKKNNWKQHSNAVHLWSKFTPAIMPMQPWVVNKTRNCTKLFMPWNMVRVLVYRSMPGMGWIIIVLKPLRRFPVSRS